MGPWPLATHIHWRTRPKERSWSDLGSKPASPAPSLLSRPKRGCVDSGSQALGFCDGSVRSLARAGNRVLRQPTPNALQVQERLWRDFWNVLHQMVETQLNIGFSCCVSKRAVALPCPMGIGLRISQRPFSPE